MCQHHEETSPARRGFLKASLAASAAAGLAPAVATAQSTKADAARPSKESASQIIESWPKTAKFTAKTMIEKYGAPAEATPTRLIWFNNGPWKRTIVNKEEVDHAFPMPHKDVMEQYVDYKVPPGKADELARYDGSVYFDRTKGEMSARCDMEAANFVALNLAHDVATGKRSVEEAREFYPKAVMAHMQKESSPYAEKLQFGPQRGTADPDKTTVGKDMIEKAEAIKQAMMNEVDAAAAGATRK
jgi:hypothetical protein